MSDKVVKLKAELPALTGEQKNLVKGIKTAHKGCLNAFKEHVGYSFVAGLQLNALKESCAHGDFTALREKHFKDVSKSAAHRHMQFFDALKSPTVGLLPPGGIADLKLLTNGKLSKETKLKLLDGVYKKADGRTITEMYRDLGIIRQPEKQKHTPAREVSAEEAVKMELAAAREMVAAVAGAIDLAVLALAHTKVSPADREEALAKAVGWTNALRECQKVKVKKEDK
jgi:hypothetical protein